MKVIHHKADPIVTEIKHSTIALIMTIHQKKYRKIHYRKIPLTITLTS